MNRLQLAALSVAGIGIVRLVPVLTLPLMIRALRRCLGAEEGMTRHSHTEKMMPREMVAAVSQRGTPSRACTHATQSDQLLKQVNFEVFPF
jgi:hypothetical protein